MKGPYSEGIRCEGSFQREDLAVKGITQKMTLQARKQTTLWDNKWGRTVEVGGPNRKNTT